MTTGRPRLYDHSRVFTLTVEQGVYATLADGMLHEFRKEHPEACTNDLVRSILDRAVAEYRALEAERSGSAQRERTQRRKRLRKLGATLAVASDDQIEVHARKVAALIDGERPAA